MVIKHDQLRAKALDKAKQVYSRNSLDLKPIS